MPEEWQGEDDPRLWLRPSRQAAAPAAVPAEAYDVVLDNVLKEARQIAPTLAQEEEDKNARTNQYVGMARHAKAMERTSRVSWLLSMDHLKRTGTYKNVPVENTKGEMVRPRNFEELCEAMGTSRATVDRDLSNLAFFGAELIEDQKNLGISDRSLRALKAGIAALPEGEQTDAKDRLTQAVESGDKTAVRELLEDLVDEKKALAKKLAEAKKATKAAEDRATVLEGQSDEKSKKASELEIQLSMALNPASEDERQKNLADARAEFRAKFEEKYRAIIGAAGSLCVLVANGRNMDRCPDLLDVALREYVDNRVSQMCQELRGLILDAGLDVDFAAEYDLEAFTGMRGEPDDFTPETDESQQ